MRNKILLAVALCGLVLLLRPVTAMESPNYALNWTVMGSGGQAASSPSYALNGTIGQASIGFKASTSYQFCSGYWCGAAAQYEVYLPLVIRNP